MSDYAAVKAWRERQPNIKKIRATEGRKWRAAHPEVARAIKERYRAKHREEILPREAEQARRRRAADPDGNRRRMAAFIARKEARQETLAGRERPSVCDLCGEFNVRIVFDHDHKTGMFRGWLCDRCNKTLGHVKDSPELLRKLAEYLEKKQ
jgi:hypothetical protein